MKPAPINSPLSAKTVKTGSELVTITISRNETVMKTPGGGLGAGAGPAVWADALRPAEVAPDWSPVMRLKVLAVKLGLPCRDTRGVLKLAAAAGYRIRSIGRQSFQIDLTTVGPTLRKSLSGG